MINSAQMQNTTRRGCLLATGAAGAVLAAPPPSASGRTNASWRGLRNEAYAPIRFTARDVRGYFVVGPGEKVDASRYPWGWEQLDFSRILVRPFLGGLERASGSIPQPRGKVEVALRRTGAQLEARIVLPDGVPGDFVWKAVRRPLHPGVNELSVAL